MPSVLFVCLGNICRSPSAEAVFRKRSLSAGLMVKCDSAGTGGWHRGDPPDERAIAAGERRGYNFAGQEARKITQMDFGTFDFILAMDRQNLANLKSICPPAFQYRLGLMLDYAPHTDAYEIPDPYYGGNDGFDQVLDLLEIASEGLILELKS